MNALVYVDCRHRPGHTLGEKNKIARNEKWKKQLWDFVYMYKIWQILKCFAGTFSQAKTLKLGGVPTLLFFP